MPCYQQPITTSILQGFHTSKFLGWQESNLDLQGSQNCVNIFVDSLMVLKWTSECSKWWLCLAFMHTNTPKKNTWSRDVSRTTNGKMLVMHSFIWSNATFFQARSRRGNQICNTTEVVWALVDSESCCCFRPGNYVLESVRFSQFPIWEPNPWWAPELPSRFLWCTAPGLKMIAPPTSHLASVDYLVQSLKGIHLQKTVHTTLQVAHIRTHVSLVHFQLDPLLWRKHQPNKKKNTWLIYAACGLRIFQLQKM